MIPPTHIAAGYLLSKTFYEVVPLTHATEITFTAIAIAGSILPDIDVFFVKKIHDHHDTPFHYPIFWFAIILLSSIIAYLIRINMFYILAFTLGIASHLFLDWLSGRTAGIRVFYPFSKKMYSLFPLKDNLGDIPIFFTKKSKKKYMKYLTNYFNNRFLVITEIALIVLALIFLQ